MAQHEEREQVAGPVIDPGERLDSWKEIATFLERGVRTVQRWEEVEGLPVHRHVHGRGGTVFAYKAELQKWYAQRQSLPAEQAPAAPPIIEFVRPQPVSAKDKWRSAPVGVTAALVLVAIGIAAVLFERQPKLATPSILISQIGRMSQTVYSPAGDRVVYCWNGNREENNLDLYVRDIQTGVNRRLTSDPNNEHSAAWSTAGDRIAFLRDKVGVFVIQPDGSNERRLEAANQGTIYGVGMSWSPDGRRLVYSERESAGTAPVLFVLDLANGIRRRVTTPATASTGDLYPSFSPDGRTIGFVRHWPDGKSGICLLSISKSGEPSAVSDPINIDRQSIAGLDWMPDGRGVMYSSDRAGLRRLWRIRFSRWSGHPEKPEVLLGAEGGWQPSVARGTQSIVYSRRFWIASIWRMKLTSVGPGQPVLNRLIGSTRIERSPAYSSDGQRIAFVSDRSGFPEIWTSDRDGYDETQWTHFQSLLPERPAWSPDKSRIAFSMSSAGAEGIYVMDSAADTPHRVTPSSLECNSPSWSHDGQWVYCSTASGVEQIWRVRVSGGAVEHLIAGSRAKESQDGTWLYFAREGALWRTRTSDGSQQKLIDAPVGDFAITQRGIYFDLGSGDYTQGVIKFYDHSTRAVTVVTQLEKRKSGGLAVSPDDRMLLLPINERQGSEVLIIGNGRDLVSIVP